MLVVLADTTQLGKQGYGYVAITTVPEMSRKTNGTGKYKLINAISQKQQVLRPFPDFHQFPDLFLTHLFQVF